MKNNEEKRHLYDQIIFLYACFAMFCPVYFQGKNAPIVVTFWWATRFSVLKKRMFIKVDIFVKAASSEKINQLKICQP